MKTFRCNFGTGISCELVVTDSAPEKGKSHIVKVTWTKKPTPQVIPQYVAWMNEVNQKLADQWGISFLHVFQTKPSWDDAEIWQYSPNCPPLRKL